MGITMTDKEKKMAGIQINSTLDSKPTSKIARPHGHSLLNANLKNQQKVEKKDTDKKTNPTNTSPVKNIPLMRA